MWRRLIGSSDWRLFAASARSPALKIFYTAAGDGRNEEIPERWKCDMPPYRWLFDRCDACFLCKRYEDKTTLTNKVAMSTQFVKHFELRPMERLPHVCASIELGRFLLSFYLLISLVFLSSISSRNSSVSSREDFGITLSSSGSF